MNFNPPMCRAGKICIAEVEEIVDIDEIPPGQVDKIELYSEFSIRNKKRCKMFTLTTLLPTGPRSIYICSKSFTWTKL